MNLQELKDNPVSYLIEVSMSNECCRVSDYLTIIDTLLGVDCILGEPMKLKIEKIRSLATSHKIDPNVLNFAYMRIVSILKDSPDNYQISLIAYLDSSLDSVLMNLEKH